MALSTLEAEQWQETRIWCPYCGQRKLLGRFNRDIQQGWFQLRCPAWCRGEGVYVANTPFQYFPTGAAMLTEVKGYRPALSRLMGWTHSYYAPGLASGTVLCANCGRPTRLRLYLPERCLPQFRGRGLHARCDFCGAIPDESVAGLVLCLPAGRHFWRENLRIRALPEREVEAGGQAALVTGFQSVTGKARLDVVLARDTYQVISIHGATGE
jgi:hypothetical protein